MADDLSPDFYTGQNVLGKPVSVSLVGQEAGPPGTTLAAGGAPTAPASGAATGVSAPGKEAAPGVGASLAQQVLSWLQKAGNVGEQIGKIGGISPDLGTRGTIGGEGTPQTSDTSLSDQLRSGAGAASSGVDALTAANIANEAGLAEAGAMGAEAGVSGAALGGATTATEMGLMEMLGVAGNAVGALTWPFTVGPLIASLFGSDINVMDMFGTGSPDRPTDFQKFPGTLAFNESQQGRGLQTLAQALPYVQSKEELGQLLNMYRQYVGSTQGAPLSEPSGVYNLTTIPGASGTEHGVQGQAVDWGPDTALLQGLIDRYGAALPGTNITDFTAQPKGADEMRLWQQFLDREGTAPRYSPGYEATTIPSTEGASADYPAVPSGPMYGSDPMGRGIQYGQPGYDYAATGWPEPGEFVGTPNPLFASLFAGGQQEAPASPLGIAPEGGQIAAESPFGTPPPGESGTEFPFETV